MTEHDCADVIVDPPLGDPLLLTVYIGLGIRHLTPVDTQHLNWKDRIEFAKKRKEEGNEFYNKLDVGRALSRYVLAKQCITEGSQLSWNCHRTVSAELTASAEYYCKILFSKIQLNIARCLLRQQRITECLDTAEQALREVRLCYKNMDSVSSCGDMKEELLVVEKKCLYMLCKASMEHGNVSMARVYVDDGLRRHPNDIALRQLLLELQRTSK
eukprot:GHVQ01012004.1.p1 GENE.GHVQ01012004.1~~GHVQ01012004.1.p1  ORF type:complete len:214 (-),score=38.13 GHVQ01012004.1:224-865(-)